MTFIFPRSYLSGLQWSTAGSSANFTVTAGQAADSTNAAIMNLPATMTKSVLAWSAGSGNGGLDTGSIANATWYHVHLIATSAGTTDILFSLSATAPTLPTGYIYFRRVCSMKTNGSLQWIKAIQIGDEFLWDVAVTDVNAAGTLTNTNTSYTLASIPTGVSVLARLRVIFTNTATSAGCLISSPLTTSQVCLTPVGNASGVVSAAGQFCDFEVFVWTSTSAQVNASSSVAANNTIYLTPAGWTDRRGKDL